MAKRKSGGNNRGGSKFRGGRGSGSGFEGGRGRGAPPVDFDIFDFPVQMWPESNGTYLSFAFRPATIWIFGHECVRTMDDLTLLFRSSTNDTERSGKRK